MDKVASDENFNNHSKKEPHSRMKISMHVMHSNCILPVVNWEVRLKPPNIALSLALQCLPGKGRDCLVFVLWACSYSARRWLDLPWTKGCCDSPASTDAKNPSRSLHYIDTEVSLIIILMVKNKNLFSKFSSANLAIFFSNTVFHSKNNNTINNDIHCNISSLL